VPLHAAARVSAFDSRADSYADAVQRSIAFSGQDHETFTLRKALHLLDLTRRRLGDPTRLAALDVGCGVGLTDRFLVERLGELHGVDTAGEAVARAAQANPGVRYQAYGGERLPYPDARFDVVFAICVAHHVPPPRRASFAAELGRVVRPGGLVALFEHNPYNPLTRLAVSRCAFDEDAVLLTRRSTRGLLKRTGLQPVESRYVIFLPFHRARSAALERRLSRLPLGAQYYVAATR
jgi:SAM-dependent methyltransferase